MFSSGFLQADHDEGVGGCRLGTVHRAIYYLIMSWIESYLFSLKNASEAAGGHLYNINLPDAKFYNFN